jgi:hypothetical protein
VTDAKAARTRRQRRLDTLARLEREVDVWVATADGRTAIPYLAPVSFLWDGATILVSMPVASATGRNLRGGGTVRLGLGPTRDVVLIEGKATAFAASEIGADEGDAFAAKTGFDPRDELEPYAYFRIRPSRIQAWRESNELNDRVLMRDGVWTEDASI